MDTSWRQLGFWLENTHAPCKLGEQCSPDWPGCRLVVAGLWRHPPVSQGASLLLGVGSEWGEHRMNPWNVTFHFHGGKQRYNGPLGILNTEHGGQMVEIKIGDFLKLKYSWSTMLCYFLIYRKWFSYTYIYNISLFRFFSVRVYYKILDIFPCAVQ